MKRRVTVFCIALFVALMLAASASAAKGSIGTQNLLITNWGTSIGKAGYRTVNISGYTQSAYPVDSLSVRVYLQWWNGFQWIDITNRYAVNLNSSYVEGYWDIPVSKSGEYRTRAVHTADDGALNDTQYSTSPSVFLE